MEHSEENLIYARFRYMREGVSEKYNRYLVYLFEDVKTGEEIKKLTFSHFHSTNKEVNRRCFLRAEEEVKFLLNNTPYQDFSTDKFKVINYKEVGNIFLLRKFINEFTNRVDYDLIMEELNYVLRALDMPKQLNVPSDKKLFKQIKQLIIKTHKINSVNNREEYFKFREASKKGFIDK